MKIDLNRQLKRVLVLWLVFFLAGAQPCRALDDYAGRAVLLNDRAANIIGSIPLQEAGFLIPEGLTGKGIIVGLADSGLDKGSLTQLPLDLQSPSGRIARVVMLRSFAGRQVPDDPIGHGTHMAGTIVGSGEASGGQFKGISPGASLYFQALLDKEGKIKIPANLEDLFYPAYSAGVRVHVNGWGEGSNVYSGHTAQVDSFVYQHPDFLPVFGAGNDGPGSGTLNSEANSKNALVVGSSQTARPVFSPEAIDAGKAAETSSNGPTRDGRTKPDLLAPGSANISLCSSLIDSNYKANPAYTRMGGTSMAASVTGGAAALLEEYLKNDQKIARPSSALLKALLINGARPLQGGNSNKSGYGLLDLAGTVLPLKEGSFVIADGQKDLNPGDRLEYQFQVTDPSRPFKATLAWIDPPSPSGTPGLVDNLDLEIIDPQGKILLGNNGPGLNADQQNNVEQVVIARPLAGKYTIRVRGTDLKGPVWSTHYALVYGQTLKHDVVSKVDLQAKKLNLASGESLNMGAYSLKGSLNGGTPYSTISNITTGSDVYISDKQIYVFGANWESGGIQILQQNKGDLLVEMNPVVRQGGYFLSLNSMVSLMLNGKPVEKAADIPAGAKITAAINPQSQTVWSVNAAYSLVSGYIEALDMENRKIKLLQDSTRYELASWCAISSQDSLLDSSNSDLPYGAINSTGEDTLAPGVKVSMTVSPSDNKVQSIKAERNVVVDRVSEINSKTGEINTEEGKTYTIFPGSAIYRDGAATSLKDIRAGDKISGVILKDLNQFIELQAYSNIIYGRVLYYNPDQATVSLLDSSNRFWQLNIPDLSYIISGGMKAGVSLAPGSWVRIVSKPGSTSIWRADLASEKQQDIKKTFRYYDQEKQLIYMTDGSSYNFTPETQMTKNGYKFTPDLLSSGEAMVITTLNCPGSSQEFLARAEVKVNTSAGLPELDASASNVNNVLVIRGTTTANKIVVIRQDGSREYISVNNDGSFSRILPVQPSEQSVSILALDTRTGGLNAKNLEVKSQDQTPVKTYADILSDPDRASIEKLASRSIVSGYGDGSFRPGDIINRADFLSILGRAGAWQVEKPYPVKYFADNGDIPSWALGSVYFARQRGFIRGYPDGTFKPANGLTREAMVAIMAQIFPAAVQETDQSNQLYLDSGNIPSWAESSYRLFYQQGWLKLFGGNSYLEPERPLTRGEAARFIDRIMLKI